MAERRCGQIGGWLLLGLDTLDDETPNEGGGRVSAEELEWLRTTLAANAGTPTVLFCHHPPVLDIGSEGFKHGDNLFDADGVDALAVRPIPPPLAESNRSLSARVVCGSTCWRRSQPT